MTGRDNTKRALEAYVAAFNRHDQELYRQHIPNDRAAAWMGDNIPLFECPDKEIEKIYYFRWWTFRKHLKEAPDGFVVTEFLPPVPWAGKHNTISCAAAHHFREGRWLRDDRDGMEYSISGKLAPNELGYRATINSYMYGDALAIAEIAERACDAACAERFRGKAAEIKRLTQEHLWDAEARFFKVLPRVENPTLSDAPYCINSLPPDLIGAREVSRLATHLTRSANGREFFIDAKVGLQYVLGSLPVDGGDFELWHRWDRNYDHAQFSPTDPDEALFAEEIHADPITGLTIPITNRLWTIRRGGKPRPILREPKWVTHEWWDADGKHVWCVWGNDTWRVRVADGEVELIPFPRHCWHSHSSRDGRLIVGDSNNGFFRGCASTVHFMLDLVVGDGNAQEPYLQAYGQVFIVDTCPNGTHCPTARR